MKQADKDSALRLGCPFFLKNWSLWDCCCSADSYYTDNAKSPFYNRLMCIFYHLGTIAFINCHFDQKTSYSLFFILHTGIIVISILTNFLSERLNLT